jgi:ankyrin repeat protein
MAHQRNNNLKYHRAPKNDLRHVGELLFTLDEQILEQNTNGTDETKEEIQYFFEKYPKLINDVYGSVEHGEVTLLYIAVSENLDTEIALFLLEQGADPNIKSRGLNGKTPLMAAVISGRIDLVEAFLNNERYPGDVHYKDNDEKTAIDYANESGNEDIIELLKGYSQGGKRRHRRHHKKHRTQKRKNKKRIHKKTRRHH